MKILEVAHVDFALYQFLFPVMQALRTQGYEVVGVCAEGDLLEPVREAGFKVRNVPFVRSFSIKGQIKAFWHLYQVIKQEKPDIVHAHMPISGFLARLAAFICRTPVIIYTCHGYLFNQSGVGFKSWCRRMLSFVLEWSAGQITDYYMTVSQEEARDCKRLRIHSSPVFIGNGRNPEHFYPDVTFRKEFRIANKVASDRIVFLIVSRLVRHKGYPELLTAFMQLVDHYPEIELWVVGERLASDYGQSMNELFIKAQEKMGNHLRLWGYRKDVDQLMKATDIFVLPSYFEGLPVSIVEAMLTGLPVISTTIRGPREQVSDGQTGLLVSAGSVNELMNALQWMLTHSEERKRMGDRGRQKAMALYSESAYMKRIMGVFEEIKLKSCVQTRSKS